MIRETTSDIEITAVDLAKIIRRIGRIFDSGALGNLPTSEALADLAAFLDDLGKVPIKALRAEQFPEKRGTRLRDTHLLEMSITDVQSKLDQNLSKMDLIKLAKGRFGIPESRLKRLPIKEVLEVVHSAVSHEESLRIIEKNADLSGARRNS